VSPAKAAEPILMPFGMLTRVSGDPQEPCSSVDGGPYTRGKAQF